MNASDTVPTVPAQLPATTCRICEEPSSLLELRDLDGLCADCDEQQQEQVRRDDEDARWEDAALDQLYFGRD